VDPQLGEVAIQPTEQAEVVTADEVDLVALQFQVAVLRMFNDFYKLMSYTFFHHICIDIIKGTKSSYLLP
jgi:hypothetical protein